MAGHRRGVPPRALSWLTRNGPLIATGALGSFSAGMAYAFSRPGLAIAPPQPGRVSIVAAIDALGPTWLVAFVVSALALWVAVIAGPPTMLRVAHALSVGVVGAYDVALWLGWWFSSAPKPTIVGALAVLMLTIWHLLMAQTYVPSTPPGRTTLDDDGGVS